MNTIESITTNKDYSIQIPMPTKWKMTIGGKQGIYFGFTEAPCWFWRKMQRLVLGFKWERFNNSK